MGKLLLKGIAASSGKVRDKVRILSDSSENNKMRKGEILVVEMTDPLYMPAIQKAAAIITNIGGILSHAAITSRELGIPCVVNTEKATEVLKDGQTVVVDGDKGEVYEG